jgi:branched-chain amino acid transport system permease protein
VYTRSSLGLALRAAAINPEASRLVGINVSRLTMVVFGLGAATAGLAGFLLSPLAYASPSIGLDFAILGFTAAVIGGLGSWPGAVVGGLVLGVVEALAFRYISSQWGDFLTFALMLTILYVRPTGLFRELGASSS